MLRQGNARSAGLVGMIAIRRLAPKDYRGVKKIERIIVDEYLKFLEETGEKDDIEPWITKDYLRHFVGKTSFAAETSRSLVGFILAQPTSYIHGAKKEVSLEFIGIIPEKRRIGIGTALMSKVTECADSHRVRVLYTSLNPNNKESARFLLKNGFEVKDWKEASKNLRN